MKNYWWVLDKAMAFKKGKVKETHDVMGLISWRARGVGRGDKMLGEF